MKACVCVYSLLTHLRAAGNRTHALPAHGNRPRGEAGELVDDEQGMVSGIRALVHSCTCPILDNAPVARSLLSSSVLRGRVLRTNIYLHSHFL